jgi:hypothetical protein
MRDARGLADGGALARLQSNAEPAERSAGRAVAVSTCMYGDFYRHQAPGGRGEMLTARA